MSMRTFFVEGLHWHWHTDQKVLLQPRGVELRDALGLPKTAGVNEVVVSLGGWDGFASANAAALTAAEAAAFKRGYDEAYAAAVVSERERFNSIVRLPEARGRQQAAIRLALLPEAVSVELAAAALSAMAEAERASTPKRSARGAAREPARAPGSCSLMRNEEVGAGTLSGVLDLAVRGSLPSSGRPVVVISGSRAVEPFRMTQPGRCPTGATSAGRCLARLRSFARCSRARVTATPLRYLLRSHRRRRRSPPINLHFFYRRFFRFCNVAWPPSSVASPRTNAALWRLRSVLPPPVFSVRISGCGIEATFRVSGVGPDRFGFGFGTSGQFTAVGGETVGVFGT